MKQLNKFTHKSWTDWNLGPNLLQINMFTFCMSYDSDPSQQDPVWWLQYTNTHGLQKSCGEKGMAWPLSKWERVRGLERAQERADPAWTGFYCFSGHGWSSFTMHRFTTGDYLLRTTKDRILLITSKTRMLQLKGETGHSPYLGGLAQTLGS